MTILDPARGEGVRPDGEATIQLAGDLDHAERAVLAAELDELAGLGARRVVIDLREVSSISGPIIRELLRARREHGFEIACTKASPAVRAVLTGTGAALVLGITPS